MAVRKATRKKAAKKKAAKKKAAKKKAAPKKSAKKKAGKKKASRKKAASWGGQRPGAGRPKGSGQGPSPDSRRNRVAIMFTDDELATLKRKAKKQRIPLSTLAYELVSRSI